MTSKKNGVTFRGSVKANGKKGNHPESAMLGLHDAILVEIQKEKEFYRKRLREVFRSLHEAGAEDVVVLDVSNECDYAYFMVICSGRSEKHLEGIVRRVLKDNEQKLAVRGVEGLKNSNWVLVDFYGIILHAFTRQAREFYKLEDAWYTAKPVRLLPPKPENLKNLGT